MANAEVAVEVAHSPRTGVVEVIALRLPPGSVVADALRRSGFDNWLAAGAPAIGVWGRPCRSDQPLRDGDRIELYRPLQIDPKDARRTRQRMQQLSGSRR